MNMSIDEATPEEWDEMNARRNKEHAESNALTALGTTYSKLINGAMVDNINNPEHYNKGVEMWDYAASHDIDFFEGNIVISLSLTIKLAFIFIRF